MNNVISRGQRNLKPIPVQDSLRKELSHWLCLETCDKPLPWRDERHISVQVATDASASGCGYSILSGPSPTQASDYWSEEEQRLDIATREALAIHKMLCSSHTALRNERVDVLVDSQAVIQAWNNPGGKSASPNAALHQIFFTNSSLNVSLHLSYVPSAANPADVPSRRQSLLDSRLSNSVWRVVQDEFEGPTGQTCDLTTLDSHMMKDRLGNPLPHFTPYLSPGSLGVNLFAQDLCQFARVLTRLYVFPPLVLVGPLLRFLQTYRQACTVVILDIYPRKYWWPLLFHRSIKCKQIAAKGDPEALLSPTKGSWAPHLGIAGDLWAFLVVF